MSRYNLESLTHDELETMRQSMVDVENAHRATRQEIKAELMARDDMKFADIVKALRAGSLLFTSDEIRRARMVAADLIEPWIAAIPAPVSVPAHMRPLDNPFYDTILGEPYTPKPDPVSSEPGNLERTLRYDWILDSTTNNVRAYVTPFSLTVSYPGKGNAFSFTIRTMSGEIKANRTGFDSLHAAKIAAEDAHAALMLDRTT